jgi:hypothetical protein
MDADKEVDTLLNDIEEEIIIPDFNLSNDADNATLAFFSNPMYLSLIKKREQFIDNTKDNKKNVKFYRKRLVSLFKDLIKDDNDSPTQELKEMYNRFVNTAMHYFQVIDKKDIIQEQHRQAPGHPEEGSQEEQIIDDVLNDIDDSGAENLTINEANDLMMKKTIQMASLDNYVITKHDNSSTEFRIIPVKLEIDLKTPNLKTKGVKLKTKVKKNKEEDLSQ